jgi:O-antigen ligase
MLNPSRLVPASLDGWLLLATGVFLFTLPLPHTISLRQAALLLALVLGVIAIVRRGMPMLPLKAPFLAWLAVAAISLIGALEPGYSLREIKTEIVYGFVTYLVFFSQAQSERQWRTWLYVLLASFLVLSAGAFVVWADTGQAVTTGRFYNGVGSYTSYWITLFPFLMYLFFHFPLRGTWRIAARIAPFLFLIPVFLTRNRTIWFAFAVSCVVMFSLGFFKLESRVYRQRLLYSLVLVLVLVTVLLAYILGDRMHELSGASELTFERVLQWDLRPGIWKFVIADLATHPWRGAGFGLLSFDHAYPQWRAQYSILFHSHNVFLDAGVQMGVPGILAMAFVFFAIGREYWRLYRAAHGTLQWIGACGLTMLAGVLVRNMTDNFFTRDVALLFWALVGMSLGYARRVQQGGARRVETDK